MPIYDNITHIPGLIVITMPNGTKKSFSSSRDALTFFDKNYGKDYVMQIGSSIRTLPEVTIKSKTLPKAKPIFKLPDWNSPKISIGKEEPIVRPVIPYTDDQKSVIWLANWLNHRRKQLYNNISNVYGTNIYRTNISKPESKKRGDIRKDGWNASSISTLSNPLQLLKGNNPRRIKLNEIYYGQINSAASAPDTILTNKRADYYNHEAAYIQPNHGNNTGHYIVYSGIPDDDLRIHERTHALNAEPQEKTIRKIINKDKYNDKYLDNEQEIYARLMQYRYKNKLNPDKIIDKDYLNKHRKELENDRLNRYDDETLIRLFNEVAENNIKEDGFNIEDVYYA